MKRESLIVLLDIRTSNSWVDKRDNASELLALRKRGVAADRWDGNDEWVEVLLGGNQASSSRDGIGACPKLCDDTVGFLELIKS
jgi:hypothetical protein